MIIKQQTTPLESTNERENEALILYPLSVYTLVFIAPNEPFELSVIPSLSKQQALQNPSQRLKRTLCTVAQTLQPYLPFISPLQERPRSPFARSSFPSPTPLSFFYFFSSLSPPLIFFEFFSLLSPLSHPSNFFSDFFHDPPLLSFFSIPFSSSVLLLPLSRPLSRPLYKRPFQSPLTGFPLLSYDG